MREYLAVIALPDKTGPYMGYARWGEDVRLIGQAAVEMTGAASKGQADFSGRRRAAKASITEDQPLKIRSIPTNRPITHSPDKGH